MKNKTLIWFILVVLLAGGGFYGYQNYVKSHAAQAAAQGGAGGFAMPVQAVQVQAGPIVRSIDTVGTLIANESLVIRPEIEGRVEKIHFTEGSLIKKGEPLVTLDNRVHKAELKQSKANLALAKTNYDRAAKLKASGFATLRSFDEAQAQLNVGEANVALYNAKLDKSVIIAPFDGLVGLRKVSEGDYVNPGQDIANFNNVDPMKIEFRIPENSYGALKPGQEVELSVDALPGEKFIGRLFAIDSEVDSASRNIAVRAFVPNNEVKLKPGMFAHVKLITERKEDALLIPEEATVPQGTDQFVYKIDNGVANLVPVKIGARANGMVEIVSGLALNDTIVTQGQIKIQSGMPVMVMPPPGAAPEQSGAETRDAKEAPAK